MYKPKDYITVEQCKIGNIYSLRSRNLSCGVYTQDKTFIGIRYKFGDIFLDREYHYDANESYGTAFPLQEIGSVPDHIPLLDRLGSYDLNTGRQVGFDKPVSDGGKGWYYLDTGDPGKNIRACSKHNKELFDYLMENFNND